MSNVVIVAIPEKNDRVWKISSEKVPHLTLLHLGESDKVANLDQLVLFVEHAVNTTLRRFFLPVDRRGELGEDQADVVFFKKNRYDYKAIRDFRSSLLQNSIIKTAYDSSDQFEGPWTPHLTLGYPSSPAKKIEDDYLYSVDFEKIAVWIDEYDGPEFELKDHSEDFDMADIPMDVAMSDLEHFGIKGMKWGVRRAAAAVGRGAKKVGRGLAVLGAAMADSSWEHSTYSDVKHEAVHNHVAKDLDTKVDRLQRSPKYRGKNLKADSDLRKEYHQDVAKVTESAYRRGVKETYGQNYTGTKSAHFVTDARGPRIEVRDKSSGKATSEAKLTSRREIERRREEERRRNVESTIMNHAETTVFPDISINIKLDDNGHMTGVGFVRSSEKNSMTQTADLGAEFLAHYGIKGMRWGVRSHRDVSAQTHVDTGLVRRQTKIRTKGGAAHPAADDAVRAAIQKQKLKKSGTASLSNKELQDLARRLQLELQVETLTSSKGKTFVKKQLGQQGQQQVQKGLSTATTKARKIAIGV